MRISNVVSRHYERVGVEELLQAVRKRLRQKQYLVVCDGDRFQGILSPRDVTASCRGTVRDCLRPLPPVRSDESIGRALKIMRERCITALPVFDDSDFIGIVTLHDIADRLLVHYHVHTVTASGDHDETPKEHSPQAEHPDVPADERTDLENSTDLLSIITNNMMDMIRLTDTHGKIIYASPSHRSVLGHSPDDRVGRSALELIHPDDIERVATTYMEALATSKPARTEYRVRHADGNYVWLETISNFLYDGDDRIIGGIFSSRDITDRKRVADALKESEERFRSIVEHSHEAILIINDSFQFEYVNDELCTILGHSRDELLDTDFRRFLDDETRALVTGRYLQHQQGHLTPRRYEFNIIRKDGRKRRVEISSAVTHNSIGQIKIIVQLLDITERKEAEARIGQSLKEKEVMLREIHHRVKNNMQIIASLLSLQSRHISDARALELFRDSENRVRSMALVHEKLYRSDDMAHVDFGRYIDDLGTHLYQAYRPDPALITYRSRVADMYVAMETAVPCGLIVNELLSNAIKHAFPDGRNGTVSVDLRRDRDRGVFMLIVSDNGIGFPDDVDFQHTETLGLQMVNLLVDQIDGTMTLEKEHGTTVTIVFRETRYPERI